jgi:hypothetical protein
MSLFATAVCCLLPQAHAGGDVRDVVRNGSFEGGLSLDGTRPEYWRVGFPDEPPIEELGHWELDSTLVGAGNVSLRLIADNPDTEGYYLTQVLDAPTFDLEGKTVAFSAQMRTAGSGGGYGLLVAYNPESPDSFGTAPVVGYSALVPVPGDTGFVTLADSFVATGPATGMAAVLLTEGGGEGMWFDDVTVVFDVAEEGTGPDTSQVDDPLKGAPRHFYVGAVSEAARNPSEAAYEDLPADIAEIGDLLNVFCHIQWNHLTGVPLLTGHEQVLEIATGAEGLGLARMLTMDFTHDDPETVGDINPMPDGTPVDSLSPEVRAAYIEELLALVQEIDPVAVSVGIETSIMYTVRPDQWDNFRLLLEEAHAALSGSPEIHITTYFVLGQILADSGTFNPELRAAWETILPYCGSVAFSVYPDAPDTSHYAPGHFSLVQQLAPGKPLLVPEFGCRSDVGQGFSEDVQYEYMYKIVSEVAGTDPPPVAVVWYQMYDNLYLGAPEWFKSAFATIGMRDYAGTPKLVHAAFRKMRDNASGEDPPRLLPALSITAAPVPVRSLCRIHFVGRAAGVDRAAVYTATGRLVQRFALGPGHSSVTWDAETAASGSYVVLAESDRGVAATRIVVLR